MAAYVPARGHIVWLTFQPQSGREQAGRRPAVVLSPAAYNAKVGLAIFCPITSQKKGYPFEVELPGGTAVSGVILSDQLKSLDWRARHAAYLDTLPPETVEAVLRKVNTLLVSAGGDA